jgi:hypothetical protein
VTIGNVFSSANQNAPPAGSYYTWFWGWAPNDVGGVGGVKWTG